MGRRLVLAQLAILVAVLPVVDALAPTSPLPLPRLSARIDRRHAGRLHAELDKGFSVLEVTGKVVPQSAFLGAVKWGWRFVWGRMMAELAPQDKSGAYARPSYAFGGQLGSPAFPVAGGGRYHLYLGNPCPWCHRASLVLALRNLKGCVGVTRLADDPTKARRGGWYFNADSPGFGPDPLFGAPDLYGVYEAAVPGFKGRCTAPLLVDSLTGTIVSNESGDIVRMLANADFGQPDPGPELYPAHLAQEIDELNEWILTKVNNGVYRCGFATSQPAYDAAATDVAAGLRKVEALLASGGGPFLLGAALTESDVRLLPTALRFDAAYGPLFKAGGAGGVVLRADLPHTNAWMQRMWALPGVAATVDLHDAWGSYYKQLFPLNPGGLVPLLPDPARDLGLVAPS